MQVLVPSLFADQVEAGSQRLRCRDGICDQHDLRALGTAFHHDLQVTCEPCVRRFGVTGHASIDERPAHDGRHVIDERVLDAAVGDVHHPVRARTRTCRSSAARSLRRMARRARRRKPRVAPETTGTDPATHGECECLPGSPAATGAMPGSPYRGSRSSGGPTMLGHVGRSSSSRREIRRSLLAQPVKTRPDPTWHHLPRLLRLAYGTGHFSPRAITCGRKRTFALE